jgi:hypothetical protein
MICCTSLSLAHADWTVPLSCVLCVWNLALLVHACVTPACMLFVLLAVREGSMHACMAIAVKSAATTVLHHPPTCEGFCPASCLPGVYVFVLHAMFWGTVCIAAAMQGCTVLACADGRAVFCVQF